MSNYGVNDLVENNATISIQPESITHIKNIMPGGSSVEDDTVEKGDEIGVGKVGVHTILK